MHQPRETDVVLEDTARRERARERLYVICQMGGWGFLLGLQIFFTSYFDRKNPARDSVTEVSVLTMVIALGLLLSHFARPLMRRWGWTQMGWRQLVPRVFGMALLLSVLWSALGYGFTYGLLRLPWPEENFSPFVLFALSCLNGTVLYVGWMCVYFIYHLFDRFNRSEIERLRLSTHVKEAELRALKSQVNPHFIFNALNSLRALIDEDPGRARGAVTQLANLLRYSLQSGQLETVAFEDELRIVNDYLALEQVRHEERLRVRMDVSSDTLALPIPPMLLQTLVENAVKYGISTRPEGGEIGIVARCEGGALHLRVTNPGAIGNADGAVRPSESTGVGLRNAAERLRLLFGERATLQLREAAPASVMAEAVIPLHPQRV